MPEDISPEEIADLARSYRLILVNAIGEGQMNVCDENGPVVADDLLTASSVPGKAMRQTDDFLRASTLARAREDVVFGSTGLAQVACIYLAG